MFAKCLQIQIFALPLHQQSKTITIKPYRNTVKRQIMTKTFSQGSNSATLSKWYRMMSNKQRSGSVRFVTEGFCDWFLRKNEYNEYEIVASTTYHSETTIDNMYNSNLKKW